MLESNDFHPGRSGRVHLQVLAAAADIPRSRVREVLELVELGPSGEPAREDLVATGRLEELTQGRGTLEDVFLGLTGAVT